MRVTLGVDVGGSTTKIVGYMDGKFISALQVRAADQVTSAYGAVGRFISENSIVLNTVKQIVMTGVGASRIIGDMYQIPTKKVDEFQSVALGALKLAGLEKALVVSMGTGTAYVRAEKNQAVHIGGTGVGGGTLVGLCQHLFNINTFETIMKTAEEGDLSKVDIIIKDISAEKITTLPPNLTAANLAKLSDDASEADMVLGFINMIFQTIGMMAVFACKNDEISTVVLTGALTSIPQAKMIFDTLSDLYGLSFIIPSHAVYATAIGAALSVE